MIQILLGIIAIAVMGYVSVVGFNSIGGSFLESGPEAKSMQYLNEINQINTALEQYRMNGNYIGGDFELNTLVEDRYLTEIPSGHEAWVSGNNRLVRSLEGDDGELICAAAIKRVGLRFDPSEPNVEPFSDDPSFGIPHCDKEDTPKGTPCCTSPDS